MLERWSHPKNMVVKFKLEGVGGVVKGRGGATTKPTSFKADFFFGQLRRE